MKTDNFDMYFLNTYLPWKYFYYQRALHNQRTYRFFQWMMIVLSLINAVLVSLQPFASSIWIKILAIICAIPVATLATVLKTFNYQEKWAIYIKTYNELEREYDLYIAEGENYSKEHNKENYFILRIRGILDQAVASSPYTTVPGKSLVRKSLIKAQENRNEAH